MTEILIRLAVGLTLAVVGCLFRLLRLGLWLLALAGLAATVAGIRWAAATVGVGPALRLAVIGWAAWATRHHRAAIRQHAAVRRLATAQQATVRKLTAALQQHTDALAAATKPQSSSSTTATTTATAGDVPAVPPWLTDDQPPDRAVTALGRYAAAWAHRHAGPAPEDP